MERSRKGGEASGVADAALLATLRAFLAAEKKLTAPVGWAASDGDLRLAGTLDIEGVTEAGFVLFGRASASFPDRRVTLGLSWQNEAGWGGNFERIEWRPVKAHVNRPNAPAGLRSRLIEGSHFHPLEGNAGLDIGLMAAMCENLPVADALLPDPPDWAALLGVAAQRWRIAGLVHVPAPAWQYDLLPLTGGKGRRT